MRSRNRSSRFGLGLAGLAVVLLLILLTGCGPTPEEPSAIAEIPVSAATASPVPEGAVLGVSPGATASAVPEGAVVRVLPETQEIEGGQSATVDIAVDNAAGLWAAELELRFDAETLQLQDFDPMEEGVQIQPGGLLSPDFVAENRFRLEGTTGIVNYAVTQLRGSSEPVSGGGLLASITFVGLSPRTGELDLTVVKLATDQGNPIPVASQGGTITVLSDAPPSPTSTLAPTSPAKEGLPHAVRPGETLKSIARQYGISAEDLAAYNDISDAQEIQVGQVIYIPTSKTTP